jgi:hypothetical protein
MQPRLGRQAEGAGSAVADEEEAVTAAVPSKATEVIVEFSLRGPDLICTQAVSTVVG